MCCLRFDSLQSVTKEHEGKNIVEVKNKNGEARTNYKSRNETKDKLEQMFFLWGQKNSDGDHRYF
jgi:hypothetical protein